MPPRLDLHFILPDTFYRVDFRIFDNCFVYFNIYVTNVIKKQFFFNYVKILETII